MSTTATATVQLENNDVRVTRWDFPPGTQTGSHTHEYDYVVVPTVGGTLTVVSDEGTLEREIVSGLSYAGEAKTKHNVHNLTSENVSFVEVELKK
ncbi:cupin domain-containing protein [Yaniella halotolerans]|uniref:cupin domain-containing protein n=1 Tax=Yaniella halotolerans TaxID=225453 RepID=UPI000A050CC6|nr:cupin domain-containing protein [Yaniella halotolerans]